MTNLKIYFLFQKGGENQRRMETYQSLLVVFCDPIISFSMFTLTNKVSKPLVVCDDNQLEVLLAFSVLHNSGNERNKGVFENLVALLQHGKLPRFHFSHLQWCLIAIIVSSNQFPQHNMILPNFPFSTEPETTSLMVRLEDKKIKGK